MMSLERAQELRNSSLWEKVVGELEWRQQKQIDTLLTCPIERVAEVQLKIKFLKEMIQLPDDVISREES